MLLLLHCDAESERERREKEIERNNINNREWRLCSLWYIRRIRNQKYLQVFSLSFIVVIIVVERHHFFLSINYQNNNIFDLIYT